MMFVVAWEETIEVVWAFRGVLDAVGAVNAGEEIESIADKCA